MKAKTLFFLIFCVTALVAKPLDLGKKFHPMELSDQFGKKHGVDAVNCSLLLITAQKDISLKLKDFIVKQKPDFLNRHHACVISDIHGMPTLITRFFALPKMRKYPFDVLLIYKKEQNPFPIREEAITVLTLGKDNTVTSIRYVRDPEKLFW